MADTAPKTLSAKLPMDVVESARIVAAYRNEQIGDLLGGILRPILAKMEQEEMAKRTAATASKPPIIRDSPLSPAPNIPKKKGQLR